MAAVRAAGIRIAPQYPQFSTLDFDAHNG